MFKVMIIDDEPIIRKGLKNIINWKQFDCEVCGEAADGLCGSELIKKLLPDIIITDIRMPEVDGLTMIKDLKSFIPESKIIILTGYRDFEYVQEAIKLGAFDFILKPSKIEELTSVINKAIKELKYNREKSDEINKLKLLFEQNIPILREKFLYDILYEININHEDIIEKMNLFQIEMNDYTLIVVENESPEDLDKEMTQYDKQLYKFGIINSFNEVFSDSFKVTSIPLNDAWNAFVIQLSDEKATQEDLINEKCAYLQKIIQSCFGFTVSLALSSKGKSILELPAKFKECSEALEHKFYIGNNSILSYNDLNSFFKYNDYSLLEKHQKFLLEGIKSGNLKVVKENLNDTLSYIEGLGNIDRQYLKDFYWNTISLINNIRVSVLDADNSKNSGRKDIGSLHKMIEKCDSIKNLHSILEDSAMDIGRKVYSFNNKSIKLVLRKAMDYIQEHYSEQVTLNEVSEHAYVSTYYISRVFKKELGKNYVDYLNEIRIEKAKELLGDIRYKTYEIAEKVGIPDAHYFSKLFKKYEGVTPTEYKDSLK
jgi:two-component system, response regulator YesN